MKEGTNVGGMFSRWAGEYVRREGKSAAYLFVGLTGAYAWKDEGENDG